MNIPFSPASHGIKRQVPRELGLVILLFDAAALFLAFLFTKYASGLAVTLASELSLPFDFHHFDTRRFYYIFLCSFILLRFALKGHYSRRVPWLGQVETI